MAGTNKIAREKLQFEQKHNRAATPADIYGVHQQGPAGYDAHLANPEGTAWKNVRRYYSSDAMAKKAIWGNIPDSQKAKFGSVDNVTSAGFTGMWGARVEGGPEPTFAGRAARSRARHEAIPEDAGQPNGVDKPIPKMHMWEDEPIPTPKFDWSAFNWNVQ
jgi:hypothetical protein